MTEEEFLKNYDSNQFFKPSVKVEVDERLR